MHNTARPETGSPGYREDQLPAPHVSTHRSPGERNA
jgi:hypothetical protein